MKRVCTYLVLICFGIYANAQCAMCRAVLESEAGQSTAKGVNDGIVYLMVIPYVLIGGLALFLYKYLKKSSNTP
ncbi:hypothetical protein N9R87_04900 [Flavobacteriaceae bacterium]|nr:hypothetical protein [Flavobacteriaceae bacterium]MDA9576454.1 hypothetical protein [Flavobacteriaceae bacterium]MDB2632226.1 hypothetical protein [Flavobacteriaceae bacterium]CAI8394010.1 MAG: Uncharacterised protein [Formosa sp. Hel3_A1_48]